MPDVKFSHVVELIEPPGFIGRRTGVLDDWRLVDLRLGDGRLLSFCRRAEFDDSKLSTFDSKSLIFWFRSVREVWEV